jgi:hypothetical protein
MTEDKLAFLDQPRDDAGRFASKSEDSQPAPMTSEPPVSEPPAVTQPVQEALTPEPTLSQPSSAPVQPQPGYIPIAAVLDEREKRQKFERELEEYKRKYEEATRKPPQPLDPLADPEAFERQLNERIERVRWDAITNASLVAATRHHGAEKVKAAEEWLQQELQSNPAIWQAIQRQPDPYDFVVSQHQRTLRLQKIGDEDPEAWAQKWAEANGYTKTSQQQPSAGGASPSPQPTLPRPSLASAPSAGGRTPNIPTGPGSAFDAVFK